MKNVLLTTTALVAMAGVAAAEVTGSGDATVGYADDGGFYSDLGLDLGFSGDAGAYTYGADMGLTVDLGDWDGSWIDSVFNDLQIWVAGGFGTLTFGGEQDDASTLFSGTSGMMSIGDEDQREMVRLDTNFGGIDVAVSTEWDDAEEEMSFGASGDLGALGFTFGYDNDWGNNEFGIGVSTSVSSIDVDVAYLSKWDNNHSELGVEVTSDIGSGASVGAYYVYDIDDAEQQNAGFTFGYDAGNGMVLDASYDMDDGIDLTVEFTMDGGISGEVFYNEADSDFGVEVVKSLGDGLDLTGTYSDADSWAVELTMTF